MENEQVFTHDENLENATRQRASSMRFWEGETSVGGMHGKRFTKEVKLELGLEGRMKVGESVESWESISAGVTV